VLTIFIFVSAWIVNFFTNYLLRNKIEKFIADTFKADDLKGPIFDYYVDQDTPQGTLEFKLWEENQQLLIKPDITYNKVFVPLVENIPYYYIAEKYLRLNYPVLYMGKPSSGKSLMINNLINKFGENNIDYLQIRYLINYNSNSKKLEQYLGQKFQYVKKNLVGDFYDRQMILFMDDINMEKRDEYESQSTIEYIRMILSENQIFNMKNNAFQTIEKLNIISCANLTSQKKSCEMNRFIHSHFIVSQNTLSDEGINSLFKPTLENHLRNFIPDTCAITANQYVQVTLSTFNFLIENLKQLPNKLHYKFNLRDVSRVFQGIHLFTIQCDDESTYTTVLPKLWFNEISRVFEDFLMTHEERNWFRENVLKIYNGLFR